MKPIRSIIFSIIAGIFILLLPECTMMSPNESSSRGGTGSEVVGVVEYPDSSVAGKSLFTRKKHVFALADGNVFIHPRSYLADTSGVTEDVAATTNDSGFFRITNVLPGEHMIYIRDSRGHSVAHIVSVPENTERINIGTLTAREDAGVAIAYTGSTPGNVLFFIDVRGTGLQLRCTRRDLKVTLNNIPTGKDVKHIITIRMYKPITRGYDLSPINLIPGVVETLQSITGD